MKHYNSYFRMYKVLMEESARQKEYMRKVEIDKILQQHHNMIQNINDKLKQIVIKK
jgi:hypothetical protein